LEFVGLGVNTMMGRLDEIDAARKKGGRG